MDDLTEALAQLPGFEEASLSIINAPQFPLSRAVESLREAAVYLGMRNIGFLLVALVTKGILPQHGGRSRVFDRDAYWRHCVGTSVAAMNLAADVGRGDRYRLFTYGIVHDLGTAVLDRCLPGALDEVHERQRKGQSFEAAETEVLGPGAHEEIGYGLLRSWDVPIEICEAVRFHHRPSVLNHPQVDNDLLHVADAASSLYYQELMGLHPIPSLDKPALERLGLDEDDITAIAGNLPQQVDEEVDLLRLDDLDVLNVD